MDPTLIHQYQSFLVASGPQHRHADSLARPVEGTTGPALQVVPDATTGEPSVRLTLSEAIYRALRNSPAIKVIAYDPAVAREELLQAEAAFDTTLFGSVGLQRTDLRRRSTLTSSLTANQTGQLQLPGTTGSAQNRTVSHEVGVRTNLPTGGQVETSYGMVREKDEGNVSASTLNPSYEHNLSVRLTQPLLRNAGTDVALAQIRIARINHATTLEAFRAAVLNEVLEVERLYWQLKQARRNVEIQQNLLTRTEETHRILKLRAELDATGVEINQALLRVEGRRADLIRVRRIAADFQDQLLAKLADASVTLLDDVVVLPVTSPTTAELVVDGADQVAAALKYNPELAQARQAIQISQIGVRVARDQIQPRLDLTAGVSTDGLKEDWKQGWDDMWTMDFLNYNLALSFEWPIGNRAARAALMRARHGRDKNIATLQSAADQISTAIRQSVRQIEASFREKNVNERAFEAAKAYLTALELRGEYRQAWDPNFLELLLNAQGIVAEAEAALTQSILEYNVAQATLARVAGTSLQAFGVTITDEGEGFVRRLADQVRQTGQAPGAPATMPGE